MSEKVSTVSVIIPTYNRAHLVGRAIQSVINQTFRDFELIVVDDASFDSTEEVVKSFNDVRIRYLKHESNRGAAAARNTGIMLSKGEYIAFQDSDDEWLPEKLEKQVKVFETESLEVGVVYTGYYRLQDNRRIYFPNANVTKKEGDISKSLLKGYFITTQAVLVRRECFEKAGLFDENLPRLQDWELFIRISKYYHFKCIDEPLVVVYHQPVSISTNQNALIKAIKLISQKHSENFKKDSRTLADYYYTVGNLLCRHGEFTQGRNYLLKAVKTYPLDIKVFGAAFVSLLGQDAYQIANAGYRKIRNYPF